MSPKTKKKVKYVRLVQLCLRICSLLGAMGMLFCVICINKTESTVGWVLKVAVRFFPKEEIFNDTDVFLARCCHSTYCIRRLSSLPIF